MWAAQASAFGLETHLAALAQLIDQMAPTVAVLDGITSLTHAASAAEVNATVARKIDLLKTRGITTAMTALGQDTETDRLMMAARRWGDPLPGGDGGPGEPAIAAGGGTAADFDRNWSLPAAQISGGTEPMTDDADTDRWALRLYVNGGSPYFLQAIESVRRICDGQLGGRVDLEVIDVRQQPTLVIRDQVVVAPTLIKRLPPPLRRIAGDLSDPARLRLGLGLGAVATDDGQPDPDG